MKIEFEPIGFVKTDVKKVPRHWTVSEAEGALVINEEYVAGLKDVKAAMRAVGEAPVIEPTLKALRRVQRDLQ